MVLELQLPPGSNTSIQLLARVIGSQIPGPEVGDPISGVPDGLDPSIIRFSLGEYSLGDFYVQLTGVSSPNGLPFPMRNGIAYFGIPWSIIDATIVVPPIIPSPEIGLCNVICPVTLNGRTVAKATFEATLEDKNNTVDGQLAARTVEKATTNESGYCILTLIQFGQFTRGGVYRLIGKDPSGRIFHDRRVIIPNSPTANAEDLEDEPEQIV